MKTYGGSGGIAPLFLHSLASLPPGKTRYKVFISARNKRKKEKGETSK
jgi:hypothetical protein